MVGSYYNQSFFRMFFIKLISHFNGVVHINHFFENCGRVVAMASPVDLSTFHHQEEALVLAFGQERNSAFCDFSEGHIAVFTVNGIRQTRRISTVFLNKNHLISLGGLNLKVINTFRNGVTGFLNDRENARSFFLISGSSRLQKTTTCIEVKVSLR